jgi:DnaJ-class molecular chaperone
MRAVLCPVCLGKGRIPDESFKGTTSPIDKQCHGCAGKGWVEVHEDMPQLTYYYPAFYSHYSPFPDPDWWSTAAP